MVLSSSSIGKPRITVIGAGRIGSTLARALHERGYPIAAIWSRTAEHAADLAALVDAPVVPLRQAVAEAELVLIAVPDDRLGALADELASEGAWRRGQQVVHCSGVLPAGVLRPAVDAGTLAGGFHPLVAISTRLQPLPAGIRYAVEAPEPLRATLGQMAQDLGGSAFDLAPEKRPLYHAAAVLASNYTVVLAALAAQLLERAGVEEPGALAALLPLLRTTIDNLDCAGLPDALTGPLVRGDVRTVQRHLTALDEAAPDVAEVYRALGEAALPLVAAQGKLDPRALEQIEEVIRLQLLVPAARDDKGLM